MEALENLILHAGMFLMPGRAVSICRRIVRSAVFDGNS